MRAGILLELVEILNDWLPPEASIAIADMDVYTLYRQRGYGLPIHPGMSIPKDSIAKQVLDKQADISSYVDASIFGQAYYGMGYFIQLEERPNVIEVILPPNFSSLALSTKKKDNFPSFLVGFKDEVWQPLPVGEIAYIESYLKKTWVYTNFGAYTVARQIYQLESMLPTNFIRIHRSILVNLHFVHSITRSAHGRYAIKLKLLTEKVLPVGQTFAQHIREVLQF
ncbi:LytTR family transcriptional regulator [Alicyclobacillaceae bacterium I2511]|nr:LytTR family transcriptional regulator [Alicyclobacillaceae bacterium I2511]